MSTARKMVYSALAAALALALLELASRLVLDLAPDARFARLRQSIDALGFPALNRILVPHPRRFWAVAPDLADVELAGDLAGSGHLSFRVSSDPRGLRAASAVAAPRARVLFLGDSCTFGVGVDDAATLPAEVQRRLGNVQCTNAGVPGYSALQGRLLLDEIGKAVAPDLVVVTFGFNDDQRWNDQSDAAHLQRLEASRSGWLARSRLAELVRRALPAREAPLPTPAAAARPRLTDAEFAGELRAIAAACRALGAEPVLVLWPQRGQLDQDGILPKQAMVRHVAETDGIKLINLLAAFRAAADPALFADGVHASAAGCARAAEQVAPVLERALAARRG